MSRSQKEHDERVHRYSVERMEREAHIAALEQENAALKDMSKPQLTWQRGPIPADGLYVTTWPDDTVDAAYYERGDQPFFDAKHSAWCGPLVVIYRKERG